MRNHEVTKIQALLKEDGCLREPGWARKQVWQYDRSQIRAPKFRIKEWDYYLVLNEKFAGAFTISDDGYIGLQSVSLLNFEEGWEHTETILNLLPMGRLNLPSSSSEGETVYIQFAGGGFPLMLAGQHVDEPDPMRHNGLNGKWTVSAIDEEGTVRLDYEQPFSDQWFTVFLSLD